MYILCFYVLKKEAFIKIYMCSIIFYKTVEEKNIKIGKGQNRWNRQEYKVEFLKYTLL